MLYDESMPPPPANPFLVAKRTKPDPVAPVILDIAHFLEALDAIIAKAPNASAKQAKAYITKHAHAKLGTVQVTLFP